SQNCREELIAILAEEGGGDAFMMPGAYSKAADFYSHALSLCRRCLDYLKLDPSGEMRHLQKRLESKLAAAQRQADIEAFGEAYCAYRDCQILRCVEKNYLRAFLAYEDLAAKFPKTVFSEASAAYRLKCLLELSEPANETQARAALAEAEKQHRENEAAGKLAEAMSKDKALLKSLRELLVRERAYINRLKAVPLGKKAVAAAEQLGNEMLRDEFGLYRGEALVDLATYAFERKLDAEEAQKRYQRAWEWLEKVESVDADLASYDVPEKARRISRPPPEEMEVDALGNANPARLDPGMVINRKTCPWYLNDLRERCALAIGFLHFARGDAKAAVAWYAKVTDLDQATKYLERQGEWTNYTRLKWGAEHGYLNAYPEELKIYRGRLRFAVLMADFYYCTQRFERAREIAERILAAEFGRLDARQDDYPRFLLASCQHWERDRKGAYLACKQVLSGREWTITQDRAAFVAGNLSWYIPEQEVMREGLEILKKLAAAERENPYTHRARLVLGLRLLSLGEIKEGLKYLLRVKGRESGYALVAREYAKALEKTKNRGDN
ncbi:MAG: hypothetical protein N3A66_00800, partial [Planctomycetota bacterium]|nr:hypothetical protein [Planctomycetota bacterium]